MPLDDFFPDNYFSEGEIPLVYSNLMRNKKLYDKREYITERFPFSLNFITQLLRIPHESTIMEGDKVIDLFGSTYDSNTLLKNIVTQC